MPPIGRGCRGLVGAGLLVLGACADFGTASPFSEGFWQGSPFLENDQAELGIAELSRGNYVRAENLFQDALRANSRDVLAQLGLGILYQNTGQVTKAREMYEAVLAQRPPESERFIPLQRVRTEPVSRIASVNLAMLESGQVVEDVLAEAAIMPGGARGAVVGAERMTRPLVSGSPDLAVADEIVDAVFSAEDANIIARFTALRALRDQGLITPDEYEQRRRANLGALTPLSTPPPAAGLGRPLPETVRISARLRAIGRALQMNAISVSQHASERALILDALMPAVPVNVSAPPLPPGGLLEAADAVRRLEVLRENDLVNSDEYTRERAAIEAAIQSRTDTMVAEIMAVEDSPAMAAEPEMADRPMPSGTKAGAETATAATEAVPATAPKPAVHLASYKTRDRADRGWAQLRRAHARLLGNLDYAIRRVNLGSKGTYYRLIAGPLQNEAAAARLCRDLKQRRQFCDPTFIDQS